MYKRQGGISLHARGLWVRPASSAGLSLRARCSTSLPGGTERPGAGRGGRPAGPAGLGLRAPGTTSLPGGTQPRGTCRRYRAACTAGLSLRALGSVVGSAVQAGLSHRLWAAGLYSRHSGTQPPCTLSVGSTSLPGGLILRCGPRSSTSLPGGKQPPEDGLRGSINSAVLSLRALCCGVYQPPRRDTSSNSGPRYSTSRAGGISLHARGLWVRPAISAGLSLRARCSTSLPGGTEPPGAGPGGRPSGPAVLSLR